MGCARISRRARPMFASSPCMPKGIPRHAIAPWLTSRTPEASGCRAASCPVAVGQGLEKRDDVPQVLRCIRRLVGERPIQRRINRVDIGMILWRNIVEFLHLAVRAGGIDRTRV